MKHIEITSPGPAENLKVVEAPIPQIENDDVLIKVKAAGINRPDLFQRMGLYDPPAGASPIPGLEVAGVVERVGSGATHWSVGDQVCALTNGGGYADYAVAPAGQCLPIPEGLTFVEAAGLPETCFTVWSNVFDRGQLRAGESLLVHGGSSGIGTTAIQMACAKGATVYVTAGSDSKCKACESLGAAQAINYRNEDFVEVLNDVTSGKGVDVILDMVGGDYVERNFKVAALDARIVSIAFLKGGKVSLNLLPVMRKRLTLTGSTLRPRSADYKALIAQNLRNQFWPEIEAGRIKPIVAQTFTFDQVADAHQLMESGNLIGKIILTPNN